MKRTVLSAVVFCLIAVRAFTQQATVVKASSFGFDPEDATQCLQAAIDSRAKVVIVDRMQHDWNIRPVVLRSGQEIVFADGVVVCAKAGEFKDRGSSLFRAENVCEVTLRGEKGAVLRMRKSDYADRSRYANSEWRHVITLRKVKDVRISGLTLESSGGDGIYVDKCENVTVEHVVAHDNYRQGMSVIGVKGLVVCDSRFCNTSGAAYGPWAGMDFEPNEPYDTIADVLLENCEFTGNAGGGLDMNFSRFTAMSHPVGITVRNCRMSGNRDFGIKLIASQGMPVRGRVSFEGCTVSGGGKNVINIVNKEVDTLDVAFRNCMFDGCNGTTNTVMEFRNMRFQTFGSVHFENSKVLCLADQEPLRYVALPENGMSDVTGTLSVKRGGDIETFSLDDFASRHRPDPILKSFYPRHGDFSRWRPVNPGVMVKPRDRFVWFRGSFSFVQHVPRAGEYPVSIRLLPIGRNTLQALVEVYGPDGNRIDRFRARGENTVYALKAKVDGVHTFRLNSFGHAITVDSPWPGQGILADVPVPIIGGRKNAAPYKFSFVVPEGTREIAVQIMPDGPGEAAQAQLAGPHGEKVCGELKGVGHLVRAIRANPETREIWTLELPTVREDCCFAIAAPCLPVVAFAPDLLLTKE